MERYLEAQPFSALGIFPLDELRIKGPAFVAELVGERPVEKWALVGVAQVIDHAALLLCH
jgi:hypothetical protein